MTYMDPNVFDDTVSVPAAAAIGDHLFAVISGGQASLATAGGAADGSTISEVVSINGELGDVSLFTEGATLVKVGTAGVTADHDVAVGTGGKAVDAAFGDLAVGRALETVADGGEARIELYERPFHVYGSGLGAERVAKVSLTGNAIHGGVQAWQNPEAVSILITKIVEDVNTPATAAATLDTGTTAVSNVTASDTLIDGVDIHTAAALFDNTVNGGTDGKGAQKLAAGKWVTFKEDSGDASGAVIDAYIFYVLLA